MIREPGGSVRPPRLALVLDRFSEQASVECRRLARCMLDVARRGAALHSSTIARPRIGAATASARKRLSCP